MLAVSAFLACQRSTVETRDHHMRVDRQLGLKGVGDQQERDRVDGTYVKDKKDPVEVFVPSDNHFLIVLRMEKSRECAPPAPFDDLPLDLRHSPAIKGIVSKPS